MKSSQSGPDTLYDPSFAGINTTNVPRIDQHAEKIVISLKDNILYLMNPGADHGRGVSPPTVMAGIICQADALTRRNVMTVLVMLAILAGVSPASLAQSPQSPQSPQSAQPAESVSSGEATEPTEPTELTGGEIDIITTDIFSAEELADGPGAVRFLRRTMNSLHIETRDYVIRRELLFKEGDPFDPETLAETERNLRTLGYLIRVSVVAVDTSVAGKVAVRIQTHETWTLKTDLSFSLASDQTVRWGATLSETNFLGHGVRLGVGVGQDENGSFVNFNFYQRRLFGTRWLLDLRLSDRSDGYQRHARIQRPFYTMSQSWGLLAEGVSSELEPRYYLSNAGPAGDDPTRAQSLYTRMQNRFEILHLRWQIRLAGASDDRVIRGGVGVSISRQSFLVPEPTIELSDERHVDSAFLTTGPTPINRVTGTTVWPYLQVATLGRDWVKTQYVLRYGSVEDIVLGPAGEARVGPAGPQVGSTSGEGARVRYSARFVNWERVGSGYGLLQAVTGGQLGNSADWTQKTSILGGWFGQYGQARKPWLTRLVGEVAWGNKLLGTEALVLGLDRGLRSLGIDGMAGDRLVRCNLEQGKVLPHDLFGFFQTGLAAFYDVGMAWFNNEERSFPGDARHEVGIGLRLGAKRAGSAGMIRLDLSWPIDEGGGPVFTAVTRGLF